MSLFQAMVSHIHGA